MAETTISNPVSQALTNTRSALQQRVEQQSQDLQDRAAQQTAGRPDQVAPSRAVEANGQPRQVDPSQRIPDNTRVSVSQEAISRFAAERATAEQAAGSIPGVGAAQTLQQQASDALGDRALRATPPDPASAETRPTAPSVVEGSNRPAAAGDFSSYAAEYAANEPRNSPAEQNAQAGPSSVGNGVDVTGNQRSDVRR